MEFDTGSDKKSLFASFWIAPAPDAVKDIYALMGRQKRRHPASDDKIHQGCHLQPARMMKNDTSPWHGFGLILKNFFSI